MSCYDCRKNRAYHNILKKYIEQIGETERLANLSELEEIPTDGCQLRGRAVGQVVSRNGLWEIHLVRVEADDRLRLVKQKLRTCNSRKIAEIVARYTAAAKSEGDAQTKASPMHLTGICWN